MKEGYPIVVRMTQADIDAGQGDSLVGMRVEVINSSGAPTGVVYESGEAGQTPSQIATQSSVQQAVSAALKKVQLTGTGSKALTYADHNGAEVHAESGITECTMALVAFQSSSVQQTGSFWLFNYTGADLPLKLGAGWSGGISMDGDVANDLAGAGTLITVPHATSVHVVYDADGWVRADLLGIQVTQSELDAALALKAPLASPAFTGTPTGITKMHVGLANVDNTADTVKPVSTAQQTALDAKQATLVSGTNIKSIDSQSILGSGNLAPTILVVTAPIAIRISGATGAGSNYQTKITVGESGTATGANFNLSTTAGTFPAGKNGTCSFMFWDSIGYVPFWVEKVTGTTPNRVATIWLLPNIDLSSGTQTVFLTTAAANSVRSNGDTVFTLFDDFDVATLDATRWDTSVISGQSIASGILSFGGGNTARRLLTFNTVGDGVEIMALLRASDTSASTSNFGFVETGASATTFNYRNVWDSASAIMVGTAANTLASNIDNGAGVRQVMRIGRASGAGRFTSESPANTFTTASGVPTTATKATIYNTYDNNTEIDWVAIKKFVTTEPAFSAAVM